MGGKMRTLRWINVIIVGLAVTSWTPAYAASWIYVGTTDDNSVKYYDADTLRRSGSQVTVWQKLDYARNKKVRARMSLTLQRYDCVNRTFTSLSSTDYFSDGSSHSTTWRTFEQEANPVIPESIGEATLNAVCSAN